MKRRLLYSDILIIVTLLSVVVCGLLMMAL